MITNYSKNQQVNYNIKSPINLHVEWVMEGMIRIIEYSRT